MSCLSIEEDKTNIGDTDILVLASVAIGSIFGSWGTIVKARWGDGGKHCTRTWLLTSE